MKKQLTIFLCKILRHEPKRFGVNVDEYGSCDMDELVEAINNQKKLGWSYKGTYFEYGTRR